MMPLENGGKLRSPVRRSYLFGYIGSATMVSIGYMDPGNWATDLEGGARFGYQLLWVVVVSNLIAILLQSLSARLGIVAGMDLAQACRRYYSPPIAIALWVLSEGAIIACDLAEVLGSAIALNLIFGIPLAWGAAVTGLDVMLILVLQKYGIRKLEAFVAVLAFTIGACMVAELFFVHPVWGEVVTGLVPRVREESVYIAIGILGATVMPHNLYLHSWLVKAERIERTAEEKRFALRFSCIDIVLALNVALFINAAILILAAGVFHTRGVEVTELRQAHELLTPMLGTMLPALIFAIALLASGQSSMITGTLAGQVVMEGFIQLRMSPVRRRLLTRSLSVVPATMALAIGGERGGLSLLVLSQIVLSLQLPFAMVPLIRCTTHAGIMGEFVISRSIQCLIWGAALAIIAMNAWLVIGVISEAVVGWWWWAVCSLAPLCGLLVWIALVPLMHGRADAATDELAELSA
ncbi:divalent metal cation transporter [Burkholderia cepacia]|uniref:Divalent metal cation transporter MntH n=2 Tax=Burkholderia cepacia complex TaxID=87882 RepID=A0A1B4PZJ2_BURCE|nr:MULTISPECIES: Nramp family divalent metal transporter [Burkholderia cepacia complex]AOK19274.1 divalent metal cation transporter [Burkholderia cepacia]AOK26032.1 divalent metal cation transporter [Burkholderia ubonensis]